MGKEKSSISKKKEPKKTSRLYSEEKMKSRATRKSNNNRKESIIECDADSLESLRETTKTKEINGIDEKIELLKSELKTLFDDKIVDKNQDYSTDKINDPGNTDMRNFKINPKNPIVLLRRHSIKTNGVLNNNHTKKEYFKPVSSSTPWKFPDQQNETKNIEQIDEQKFSDKPQNSKRQTEDNSENSVIVINDSKCNTSSLYSISQEKLEEMLYKSFVLQNSELNLPQTEKNNKNEKKSKRKITKEKNRTYKNPTKNCTKRKTTSPNLKIYCRYSPRGKKGRMINLNSSQSDVEVIDLDNSPSFNKKTKNESVYIDLEIKDYNWNEPFDLNETEFHSEVEIIKPDENKNKPVNEEPKLNVTETTINNCSMENGKDQLNKKTWECPVCFEQSKGQQVVATQCGHIFCKKCLEKHFSKFGKTCPSCRFNLSLDKPFIILFNF